MSGKKEFADFDKAIEHIIGTLDESEIEAVKNADPAGLHMALDRWIKKDYVFSDTTNINDLVCEKVKNEDKYYKDNPDAEITVHPDNISGIIIDGLIEKLQK
ncbi:MAG: hypothetical protein GWO07_14225 [Candidatus Dadabacteria bacterium]|nr:hypothetical protein [Candidatus Dadabacteria bacterium]